MTAMLSVFLLVAAGAAPPMEKTLSFRCQGLEDYSIVVQYDVDAGGGMIRANGDGFSLGIGLGPMLEPLIPAERPAGLRWMKVERIGRATVRYGYVVRTKMLVATIEGAPIGLMTNLVARPKEQQRFLAIVRTLVTAPCTHA